MADVKIRCRQNGPLVIEGSIEITGSDGNPVAVDANKPAVALCRCGSSGNKPFCDGTHNKVAWKENPA